MKQKPPMPKALRRHRKMRTENIETGSSMLVAGCSAEIEYRASRIKYQFQGKRIMHAKHGQSLLEYVILISIVGAVLVAMGPYMKRGVQAVVKVTADQLANQEQAEQSVDSGYLVEAFST